LEEVDMALAVILGWYLGIGVLAAIGVIAISRQRFTARVEPILFGLLLTPIAAMYLAFGGYFGATASWRLEGLAVAGFALLGVIGIRLPLVLALGYLLHGAWDLVHEISPLTGGLAPNTLTAIPLAYGGFCAAFDWIMAGYFYTRRDQWEAARRVPAA
jgi:hypothetical protein